MLKCLLKTLKCWDWLQQKKATQSSAHSWESIWGVVSTKPKIIAAKVLFHSELLCQDSTWSYLKTCWSWVLCDRLLKHHMNRAMTCYHKRYLEFSWPSSWTFISLPPSSSGPRCCPEHRAVLTSFDKILKPGEGREGRERACWHHRLQRRQRRLTTRSCHRRSPSNRGTCLPNGLFPVFLEHVIVLPEFENFDFLKLSLRSEQDFFVQIPPRDSRSLKTRKPKQQKQT